MYNIPKEINSETKVLKSIYLFDLFCIIISLIFTMSTVQVINPKLSVLYYIFSFIVTLFLISKSKTNPGIRNFRALYIMLRRVRKTYKSIDWNFEEIKGE